MIVYLSVMLLCCILLYVMRNNKNRTQPLAIAFGLIWLMVSLQDGWGGDRGAYYSFFTQLHGLSLSDLFLDETHGEIGYKIVFSMMPSAHAGLVLGIGIWCFSLAFFFYHFIPQKWWWFAILFVFFDKAILMGMVSSFLRMAVADSLLIFAVFCVLKDKRLLSAGLIILGSFFHRSVLFMLPLIFVGKKYNKISMPMMIGIFSIIVIVSMISPSSWFEIVDSVVSGTDALSEYSFYLEEQQEVGVKGIVLIIIFYWIYWLSKTSQITGFESKEYLVIYYALLRVAFDLLPAVGFTSRFFYYLDPLFFAGMMCVLNRMPSKSIHRYGIMLTLLLIFWYDGFRVFSHSEQFISNWLHYNPIF